jgi:catechol 2,3-dioxygenase-like lactoylglutathione lyase family enzyme
MTRTISGITPFFIVANVPAALSFYRDMLGFEVKFRGQHLTTNFLGLPSTRSCEDCPLWAASRLS